MKKCSVLMCPPHYYDIVYEINPWMCVCRKADSKKAGAQWKKYVDLLTGKLGVHVELVDPVRGLPDMVFTANAGLVRKRIFVRSNFRHRERRGEETFFDAWFKKKGYIVKSIPRPFCFEGAGDAVYMGDELYTGFHFRSDLESHDLVSACVKSSYFALGLCDARFYHLDTCFAPLDERTALVYLPAFEPYAQMIILENVPDPVKVPKAEALRFACNVFVNGRDVVMPAGCPRTAAALKKRGFRVHALEFSEFIKAGGAAACLVLKLSL